MSTKLEDMLESAGARLVRDKNHLVYVLPNGKTFTASKTPSDYRQEKNAISDLRKLLKGEGMMEVQDRPADVEEKELSRPDNLVAEKREEESPTPAQTGPPTLRQKIESEIAEKMRLFETHMHEAQKADRAAEALRKLLEYADDDGMADALKGLLFEKEPVKPAKDKSEARKEYQRKWWLKHKEAKKTGRPVGRPASPPPPDRITNLVQVTQQLVLAATATFDKDFRTEDLVLRMLNGAQVDADERRRIRSSISSCLTKLETQGQVRKVKQGVGRVYGLWRKV